MGRRMTHRRKRRRAEPRRARVSLAGLAISLVDPQAAPERAAELALLREAVRLALGTLTRERREVLELWLGLWGGSSHGPPPISYTADEIARVRKVSRERVCAVRNVALAQLRARPACRDLLWPFVKALLADSPGPPPC